MEVLNILRIIKQEKGIDVDKILSINFPILDLSYNSLAVILNSYKGNP